MICAQDAESERGKTQVFFVIVLLSLAATIGVASALTVNLATHSTTSPSQSATAASSPLRSFSSLAQLQSYMASNAASAQDYDQFGGAGLVGGPGTMLVAIQGGLTVTGTIAMTATMTVAEGAVDALSSSAPSSSSTPSYTGTNDQVAGVDELDIVKTDGTYLYVATNSSTGSGSAVDIIQAYPPSNQSALASVSLTGQVLGIEISQGRLMVVEQEYSNGTSQIGLLLYNTTAVSSPKLMENVTTPGTYISARMAEGYLYAIVQQPSYTFNNEGNATGVAPYYYVNGEKVDVSPSSVYYTSDNSQIGDYTMLISIDMSSGAQSNLAVLTGPSSTVYVSTSNIYVVYSDYRMFADTDDIPGDVWSGGVAITSPSVQLSQNSTIFRAAYTSNGTVTVQAVGTVPGSVLNQYSMGDYDAYFMVATSRVATIDGNATTSDDVYVLNSSMGQVSALQNIAPGENLYAVRFVGDMGYVVTFEQVDPLFTISFADITHPVIESALKVNGYSDYLQPLFNGSYLLGVGKDTVQSSTGDFAYYTGLKLSLFHIEANGTSSDVQDTIIGDRGTDSPVLTDPLALTYDPANNITVIPVLLAQVPANEQNISTSQGPPPQGNPVWQGAYVFQVNSTGLTLLGKVSQYPAGQNYGDSTNNNLQIERSVIIGSYLYTISQSEVMVSSLSTFATLATISLPGSS